MGSFARWMGYHHGVITTWWWREPAAGYSKNYRRPLDDVERMDEIDVAFQKIVSIIYDDLLITWVENSYINSCDSHFSSFRGRASWLGMFFFGDLNDPFPQYVLSWVSRIVWYITLNHSLYTLPFWVYQFWDMFWTFTFSAFWVQGIRPYPFKLWNSGPQRMPGEKLQFSRRQRKAQVDDRTFYMVILNFPLRNGLYIYISFFKWFFPNISIYN